VLLDFKTSRSGAFGDTAFQLAAYRYADAWLYGDTENVPKIVDECGVVWLRADGYDLYPYHADKSVHRQFLYIQQCARAAGDSRDYRGDALRGRLAHLFELALLLTGQNQAEAEDLLQIALERAYRAGRRCPGIATRSRTCAGRWSTPRLTGGGRCGGTLSQRLQAADCGPAVDDRTSELANRDLLLRSPAGETAPRATPRGAGEFAGLGPGLTTLAHQSRMHSHLIFAGGRATGCRSVCSSPPCRALGVQRLGQVVVSWLAAGSRGHTLAAWWGRP
jgi:hypothetical protein